MRAAEVIVDIPTQALDTAFTYVVPDSLELSEPLEVGCAVLVPFGGRKAVGFVMALGSVEEISALTAADTDRLKPIEKVLTRSFFDEEGAATAKFIAEHYIAPLSACVRLFTPPGAVPRVVRGAHGGWRVEAPTLGEVDDRWVRLTDEGRTYTPRANAYKQQLILTALQSGELRVTDLTNEIGAVDSTLKALEEKGVIAIERRRRLRNPYQLKEQDSNEPLIAHPCTHQLTEGQLVAIDAINKARAAQDGSVVLVDGVTGSGKTEVYLQAIEATLEAGRSAIVLVPEISLTPQTVARFRGRFGNSVAVLHSRMSHGERFDTWDMIREGRARVVVGPRSALFAPLTNVGLIVIDEEHEQTYKQENAPRYHAREVAAWMAARSGAALVLGSATPSIETLHRCAKDERWQRVVLAERANGQPMPPIEVIDMAQEFGSGSRSMFSRRLTQALTEELRAGRKVVLLLNQRGFARFVLCRECGFVPECPSCSTSLTYHEDGAELICHHCGYHEPLPSTCPHCESPYLRKFGAGTQRVESDLRQLLNDAHLEAVPIIRMDADTTKTKGSHQALLEQFGSAGASVLLGTQMIAKGLDFDEVTLVGVINADTQLNLPDYRAGERTFNLVEQVAGRAGRATLAGRVLVQTYEANAAAIAAAAHYDRVGFLNAELPKRRLLGYPPYARLANVLVWGSTQEATEEAARELEREVKQAVFERGGSEWEVLPASPCVLEKLRGTYRWHILVKAPPEADIAAVLTPLFRSRKASDAVNVAVDVDPMNLL